MKYIPTHLMRAILPTVAILTLFSLAAADCECGYAANVNSTRYVFTEILETDFLHLGNISLDTDWYRQGYNVSAKASRGTYGTAFQAANVIGNPVANNNSWSGPGKVAGDTGLQLYVRGGIPNTGLVPTAEIDSARTDLLYGSYRASMKLANVSGTCGAFFWYHNDSSEVDMEFLSEQFNYSAGIFPVNLVMQNSQSAAQGFQTEGANYQVAYLDFDPSAGFHEYRIDFVPGKVLFYADGQIIGNLTASNELPGPGHLILTHWSNGNPGWSFGPPKADTAMTVSYVKAYFNSSATSRQSDFKNRCSNPKAAKAVCNIPDQTVAPDQTGANGNVTANTMFFSRLANSTNNQTIYHNGSAAPTRSGIVWPVYSVLIALFIWSISGMDLL